MTSLTYRDAGVDIAAGDALVEAIKPLARATTRPGTMGGLGGFGALFDLRATGLRDPVLVASTDGVGTKLRLAIESGRHDTVGIDLVAMCVNDLVVQGAEPLFFLDYFATGKLRVEQARAVISGIAEGCRQAGCALVGGETAEMPGMYAAEDYDLAGFAVGAAERDRLLPRRDLAPGDAVLGLASTGVHANGFSLVRRVMSKAGLLPASAAPFAAQAGAIPRHPPAATPPDARPGMAEEPMLGRMVLGVTGGGATREPAPAVTAGATLGEALLAPTRIYVRALLALHRKGLLKAAAHVTGGGLPGNLPRVLPTGIEAVLDAAAWPVPPVFGWLAEAGGIAADEMLRVFNCGIGMAIVVAEADRAAATHLLETAGERVFGIGHLVAVPGAAALRVENLSESWPRAAA